MGFWAFLISLLFALIFLQGEVGLFFSGLTFIIFWLLASFFTFFRKIFQKKEKSDSQQQSKSFFKEIRLKQGVFCLLGMVGAYGIVSLHLWYEGEEYLESFWWENQFISSTWENTGTPREKYLQYGMIVDTQKYHKYLFESSAGENFLLSTNQTYQLGDHLYVMGSLKRRDPALIFPLYSGNFFEKIWTARENLLSTDFRNYEFNYDTWIFMKGIDGTLYEKKTLKIPSSEEWGMIQGETSDFLSLWRKDQLRANLQEYLIQIYGENKYVGLLLGLLIWDKSYIPTEEYDTFVDSGLVHIIAVSGGNIAMVVILLSFLLKWIPFYVRNGMIILMVILYACLCGGDSSVVRATVMGVLTLLVLFLWREISLRRSLKYACMFILLISPFSLLYDVGFLLSFSAIIGIVLFQKLIQILQEKYGSQKENLQEKKKKNLKKTRKQKIKQGFLSFLNEYGVPTVWATLGTAPILLFFMNGVNLTGVVLNLFIVPLIPLITIYGFGSGLIFYLLPREGWIEIEKWLMDIVFSFSQFGAKYAIFFQAKNTLFQYLFLVFFVWLLLFLYIQIYKKHQYEVLTKKESSTPKGAKKLSNEDFFEEYFEEH